MDDFLVQLRELDEAAQQQFLERFQKFKVRIGLRVPGYGLGMTTTLSSAGYTSSKKLEFYRVDVSGFVDSLLSGSCVIGIAG